MKKAILILVSILIGVSAFAQTVESVSSPTSLSSEDSLSLFLLKRINQHTAPYYKLYPTENMWNFLELETFSGRIWQVQFAINNNDARFVSVLNDIPLTFSDEEDEIFAGRFELYPTENMYNFILLDTFKGSTWQVQWSLDPEKRMILRIR